MSYPHGRAARPTEAVGIDAGVILEPEALTEMGLMRAGCWRAHEPVLGQVRIDQTGIKQKRKTGPGRPSSVY